MTGTKSSQYVALVALMLFISGSIPESTAQSDYAKAGLERHNEHRAKHKSPPMKLDTKMNENADKCAEYYANIGTIDHSCPHKSGAGENLGAMGSSGSLPPPVEIVNGRIDAWYSEIKDWNFDTSTPKSNAATGHFTQVVWVGSTELGIGYAQRGQNVYVVGLYKEHGNNGMYKENVPPLGGAHSGGQGGGSQGGGGQGGGGQGGGGNSNIYMTITICITFIGLIAGKCY